MKFSFDSRYFSLDSFTKISFLNCSFKEYFQPLCNRKDDEWMDLKNNNWFFFLSFLLVSNINITFGQYFLLFSTIFPTSINLAADCLRHHCFHEFFFPWRILPDFFHIDVFSLSISWSKLHFLPCLNCPVICKRKVLWILELHTNA